MAKSTTRPARLVYSVSEAAEALGVSRGWVYLRMQDGTIAAKKIGGRTVIAVEELDRLLDEAPDYAAGGAK